MQIYYENTAHLPTSHHVCDSMMGLSHESRGSLVTNDDQSSSLPSTPHHTTRRLRNIANCYHQKVPGTCRSGNADLYCQSISCWPFDACACVDARWRHGCFGRRHLSVGFRRRPDALRGLSIISLSCNECEKSIRVTRCTSSATIRVKISTERVRISLRNS